MNGFSGSWPRPFAIGVLVLADPDDTQVRVAERLDLALDAYRYGYYLLDTVEVGADGAGYTDAEDLAARGGADVFVTRGRIDERALAEAASSRRLVVRGDHRRRAHEGTLTV